MVGTDFIALANNLGEIYVYETVNNEGTCTTFPCTGTITCNYTWFISKQ